MARKKKTDATEQKTADLSNVRGLSAKVTEQPITETLERRTRPSAFGADRVFPLSVLLAPFRTSEKELALRGETLSSAGPPANTKRGPLGASPKTLLLS